MRLLGILCATLALAGCFLESGSREGEEGDGAVLSDGEYTPKKPVPPPGWPQIQWPSDNPYSAAKAILGRRLFFETDLSRDGTVTCTWCHAAGHAFTDKHRTAHSTGVRSQPTLRNTPTLANVAFATSFLFDGSQTTLEQQVLGPLYSTSEMDMTGPEIEARLAADTLYVRLFRQAYGEGPITMAGVVKALATYQRTLISYRSPYDRWKAGDEEALSASAKRGAAIFFGEKGDCVRCHALPLFTDGKFHNNGLDSMPADLGRAMFTQLASDAGRFKTPTLRNLTVTNPYMHDGRFATLEDVVVHYNSGGYAHPTRDSLLHPLGLDDYEILDLVTFLESLTDLELIAEPQF